MLVICTERASFRTSEEMHTLHHVLTGPAGRLMGLVGSELGIAVHPSADQTPQLGSSSDLSPASAMPTAGESVNAAHPLLQAQAKLCGPTHMHAQMDRQIKIRRRSRHSPTQHRPARQLARTRVPPPGLTSRFLEET